MKTNEMVYQCAFVIPASLPTLPPGLPYSLLVSPIESNAVFIVDSRFALSDGNHRSW